MAPPGGPATIPSRGCQQQLQGRRGCPRGYPVHPCPGPERHLDFLREPWLLEIPSCHCLPPTVGSPPSGSPSHPPGRGPSARGGPAPRRGHQEAPTPGAKEATTRPCSLLKGSPSPLLPAPTPPLPASAPALTSCCPGWPPPDLTVLSPGRQAPSAPSDSPRPRPAPSSRWGTARPLPRPAPFSVVTLPARPPPPSPTPKIKARCHHHRPGAVSPPAAALLPGSPGCGAPRAQETPLWTVPELITRAQSGQNEALPAKPAQPLPPCGGRLSVCSLKMVTVPPGGHRVRSAPRTGWWLPHQTVQTASPPHTSPAGQRRSRDPLKKTLQLAQNKGRPGQEACGRCRRWANPRLQRGERTNLGQYCPLPAAPSEASTPESGLRAGKPHPHPILGQALCSKLPLPRVLCYRSGGRGFCEDFTNSATTG